MTPEEILRLSSGVDYAELYEACIDWCAALEDTLESSTPATESEYASAIEKLHTVIMLIEADAVRNARAVEEYKRDDREYGSAATRAEGLGGR